MIIKFLNELRNDTTKEEFIEILKIAEDDIKFNRIGFNKITKEKGFVNICNASKDLIKKMA